MTPALPAPPLLRCRGLGFAYGTHTVFAGLSADIRPGITLVRGGDGQGKTTLLRLLAGELAPAAGQLQIGEHRLDSEPDAYRARVFWVDPRTEAFDQTTPASYLASRRGAHAGLDDNRLAALVEGLGLAPHLHKQLYMLSTGSKRKTWLAAAFMSDAPITLLDMPFAALDKASIGFVIEQLRRTARDSKRALVIADHEAPHGVKLAATIELDDRALRALGEPADGDRPDRQRGAL